MADWLVVWLA